MQFRIVLATVTLALLPAVSARACSAFSASCGKQTLVGNNEDYNNPHARLWIVPGATATYGRMYLGYEAADPQGGMNEAGLFFDGFAVDRQVSTVSKGKPGATNILDKVLAECANVEEVVRFYEQHDRSFLESAVLMYVDRHGDAVAIEANAIVRKTGPHFVQTNFRQSNTPKAEVSCPRFKTAARMLADLRCATVDSMRAILAATSVEGQYPTMYSNVYDLERRLMHLYYFRDYAHPRTIDLAQELKKGAHTVALASLFPDNEPALRFARQREHEVAQELAKRTATVDDAVLERYVGRYQFQNGIVITIKKHGTGLQAETPGPSVEPLLPESATTFFVPGTPAKMTFIVGASGKVERVDLLSGNGATLVGQRIATE